MTKTLVAYYSRAGENYVGGQIKDLKTGNTEIVAREIAKRTGADLIRIEQKNPYSYGYNDCIEEARKDQRNKVRPELTGCPDSLDGYDTIYLGYPNYWNTMPMAVFTFLEKYDFSGKTILPFCTHEGSGMGASEADLRKTCPSAKVKKGLAIQGCKVFGAENAIGQWIGENE